MKITDMCQREKNCNTIVYTRLHMPRFRTIIIILRVSKRVHGTLWSCVRKSARERVGERIKKPTTTDRFLR